MRRRTSPRPLSLDLDRIGQTTSAPAPADRASGRCSRPGQPEGPLRRQPGACHSWRSRGLRPDPPSRDRPLVPESTSHTPSIAPPPSGCAACLCRELGAARRRPSRPRSARASRRSRSEQSQLGQTRSGAAPSISVCSTASRCSGPLSPSRWSKTTAKDAARSQSGVALATPVGRERRQAAPEPRPARRRCPRGVGRGVILRRLIAATIGPRSAITRARQVVTSSSSARTLRCFSSRERDRRQIVGRHERSRSGSP